MSDIFLVIFLLAAGTWLAAITGAAAVILIKKGSGVQTQLILGFAAGVILIVSFTELLHPAIHMSERYTGLPAWLVVPGAFALGFCAAFLLDMYIGRLKAKGERSGRFKKKRPRHSRFNQPRFVSRYKRGLVLFGALSVHNIPEGLALGVLLGALGHHFEMSALWALVPLVAAVALHKIPEGAAIATCFYNEGMPKLKSFLVGQASGLFGFLAGIAGFAAAVNFNAMLPYAMAFAGGAMVWVAVHELIPESKCNSDKKPYHATVGICLGVLMMLIVDTTLHGHKHVHVCGVQHEYWCCE